MQGVVAISRTDCISSGFTLPVSSAGTASRIVVDPLREVVRLRVEDHQLLLHADGEGGAGEVVFDHGERYRSLGAGASDCPMLPRAAGS